MPKMIRIRLDYFEMQHGNHVKVLEAGRLYPVDELTSRQAVLGNGEEVDVEEAPPPTETAAAETAAAETVPPAQDAQEAAPPAAKPGKNR